MTTTPRHQLRLLTARLDAAIEETLAGCQRRYVEAAERIRGAAGRLRVVDADGANLIRPGPGMHSAHLTVGDLTLIPPHKAVRGTRGFTLGPAQFGVLRLLMANAGEVVPHARFLDKTWGPGRGTIDDLRDVMKKLRAKVGDQPPRIDSVYGVGYILRAASLSDPAQQRVISVGNLVLDPLTRTATRDNRPLTLSRIPFSMLERLMRQPGQAVTRDELAGIAARPGGAPVTRYAVSGHMSHLRGELGVPELIQTVPRVGYVLREP